MKHKLAILFDIFILLTCLWFLYDKFQAYEANVAAQQAAQAQATQACLDLTPSNDVIDSLECFNHAGNQINCCDESGIDGLQIPDCLELVATGTLISP